ncbi:HD domain-containing phosphohydrolase [Sporosarcina sp. E16_8]|uniref:HD domain-containing phosphohydrolase n=1 Tax=Sporosarcina sp. E16_8 TaxID=2789295 RepID=UPI001A90F4B2|nr:HD domain-containing phosphohydrolase [Sporosarcina sp. E16_8]MBO0589485.1 diguanylate cyclase [Sporosarcina sp. E16_8]
MVLTIRLNDGLIVNANKEFTTLLGYAHEEFIGKTCLGINLYANPEEHNKRLNELSEKGSCDSKEVIFRRKDGTVFTGLMSSEIVELSAGKYIFKTIHKITEHEVVEEKEDIESELKARVQELVFQSEERADRAAELVIANKELVYQTEEKADRAAELVIANKELVYQTEEKADRAAELVIANKELIYQTEEKADRAAELVIANKELVYQTEEKADRAAELVIANKELVFQNEEKAKRAAELLIANKELVFQNEEKAKRAAELLIANKELVFQNEEKAKHAAELLIANKELVFQNEEKAKRAAELLIANKELVFQNEEKAKRAAELLIANKELVFQNEEKAKRAAELLIANKELVFQNEEKADRAAELLIANKELVFQTEEKADRAAELVIANIELVFQNAEKVKHAAELLIANKELVFQNEEKAKRAEELLIANKELVFQNEEILYLSHHDQLTGLYNRRFFEEKLKRLDTTENLPLTIVVGDINGLKLINDSFGHAMGDELLKKSAEVIKKGCRAEHIVSRTGGDEFVILLPKTEAFEAELIIKRISELLLPEKVGSIDVSISFGYETKNNEEDNIQEVLKKADKHMYNNKLFESPSMKEKTVDIIIKTLHEKNKSLEEHSQRVSKLCERMGEVLGLSTYKIMELKTVGLLHDIGKIAIDENILNKPGKLTDNEWKEIKRHSEIGFRILNTANDMSNMAEYVLSHHERWDGKGYPRGLKGKEIPFESRIIAITDAYDAMTSERAYHRALSSEVAVAELQKNAGIQFDPELVILFIEKALGSSDF